MSRNKSKFYFDISNKMRGTKKKNRGFEAPPSVDIGVMLHSLTLLLASGMTNYKSTCVKLSSRVGHNVLKYDQ